MVAKLVAMTQLADSKGLVPKKGLEPPHPCGYMDLNHARLPIPPLRRQILGGDPRIARQERTESNILQG